MAYTKSPIKGTQDILPSDEKVRNTLLDIIKDTYLQFGFMQIETPILENISNLTSGDGGENEKLIFKILKRGDKLNLSDATNEADVVDYGLRYDLTLPLSRYFANNISELPSPFKAIQIGPVFRADRPQRGRFRQFYQCDIDIIGEDNILAEIDLITASSHALNKIGFKNYTFRINDRRLLCALIDKANISTRDMSQILIILDKLDKIGLDNVCDEISKLDIDQEKINTFTNDFKAILNITSLDEIKNIIGDEANEAADSLRNIIEIINTQSDANINIKFDPSLVRGMGYYTSTIFEISLDDFELSIGGGGRYDSMTSRFGAEKTSAVGISLGFERLAMLAIENNLVSIIDNEVTTILVDKKLNGEELSKLFEDVSKRRSNGEHINLVTMKKNKKKQKEDLQQLGYTKIEEIFNR